MLCWWSKLYPSIRSLKLHDFLYCVLDLVQSIVWIKKSWMLLVSPDWKLLVRWVLGMIFFYCRQNYMNHFGNYVIYHSNIWQSALSGMIILTHQPYYARESELDTRPMCWIQMLPTLQLAWQSLSFEILIVTQGIKSTLQYVMSYIILNNVIPSENF